MSDRKTDEEDKIRDSRQNIYGDDYRNLLTVKDASRLTGYAIPTVKVICVQLNLGKKIGVQRLLTADDVGKIVDRRNSLHQHVRKASVNMSQVPNRPLGLDPLIWKLFSANRDYTNRLELALNKQSERLYDMRKSLAIVAGDLESLKAIVHDLTELIDSKRKGGNRGRGVSILGRTAPLTLDRYEATAA